MNWFGSIQIGLGPVTNRKTNVVDEWGQSKFLKSISKPKCGMGLIFEPNLASWVLIGRVGSVHMST